MADRLPAVLAFPSADPLTTGVVALVLGVVSAWVVVAADTFLGEALTALRLLAAGAALPSNLAGLLNPATVFGITVAGFLDWQNAAVAVAAALVGAVVGAVTARGVALESC